MFFFFCKIHLQMFYKRVHRGKQANCVIRTIKWNVPKCWPFLLKYVHFETSLTFNPECITLLSRCTTDRWTGACSALSLSVVDGNDTDGNDTCCLWCSLYIRMESTNPICVVGYLPWNSHKMWKSLELHNSECFKHFAGNDIPKTKSRFLLISSIRWWLMILRYGKELSDW